MFWFRKIVRSSRSGPPEIAQTGMSVPPEADRAARVDGIRDLTGSDEGLFEQEVLR